MNMFRNICISVVVLAASACLEQGDEPAETTVVECAACHDPGLYFGSCIEGTCVEGTCVTLQGGSICAPQCAMCTAAVPDQCIGEGNFCIAADACLPPCASDSDCPVGRSCAASGACEENG